MSHSTCNETETSCQSSCGSSADIAAPAMACSLPIAGSDPLTGQSILASACDGADSDFVEPEIGKSPYAQGLQKAIALCFDDLKTAPRSILIIGGCRQKDLARHLAFIFPSTRFMLLDPDARAIEEAQAHFQCRLKFTHAPVEALPFEDSEFDVVVAHNLLEFVDDWPKAMGEIGRVCQGLTIASFHRPSWLWNWVGKKLPGMDSFLQESGVTLNTTAPEKLDLLIHLNRYGKITTQTHPYPWWLIGLTMKPIREERTVFHSIPA